MRAVSGRADSQAAQVIVKPIVTRLRATTYCRDQGLAIG
jgi:hypothetical protein